MAKIRVLVVDDAVVMRRVITDILSQDPAIEVVGVAANGKIALQRIPQLNPDVITLDVEMPEMDGIETLRAIRKSYPRLPVIMFSTLVQRGAEITIEALSIGANDYVTKPANMGSVTDSLNRLRDELIPKIKTHCRHLVAAETLSAMSLVPAPAKTAPKPRTPGLTPHALPEIVAVGTSTGGPNALAELFSGIRTPLPVPIVIVQHMPPIFTRMLAERLQVCHPATRFHEGMEGQILEPGNAYIAPGGKHMEIRRVGLKVGIHLHEGPPENSCRPAVDVLFRSVVAAYADRVLAVIMTGMGQDGYRGCQLVHERRGQIIVQDEATSVVWGMPGYVANAGIADTIAPLPRISHEIWKRFDRSPRWAPHSSTLPHSA